jgi:hypothetical protein
MLEELLLLLLVASKISAGGRTGGRGQAGERMSFVKV